jgi:hypothetical protein
MFAQNKVKIVALMIGLFIVLLSAGCITSSSDNAKIIQIGKNIEKAIKEKDVNLFMENVSYDYSDLDGGTYDNRINGLPEEIFSQMKLAEDLANSVSGWLNIVTDVKISDLTFFEQYASGKIEIKFSLKVCLGTICTGIPGVDANESIEYNVDFIKEGDDWKIISMIEM